MSEPRFDVVGIGNALVDVIAHAHESFLDDHALVKGSMQLVETDRADALYRALGTAVEMSGGSAANTMCGVASFGGRAAYIGKVSGDDLGTVFGHDLNAVGVAFRPGAPDHGTPTGRSIIVVTPDAQRTMNTYLGAAELLSSDDLDEAAIADGAVLYMEGYLFDRDEAKRAFRRAAAVAHDERPKGVADAVGLVLRRPSPRRLRRAHPRRGRHPLRQRRRAVLALRDRSPPTRRSPPCAPSASWRRSRSGKDGSVIVTADEVIDVPAEPVARVLDTPAPATSTPPGSCSGYTRGRPLAECGRLGSIAASEVISHVGPRPLVELRTLLP